MEYLIFALGIIIQSGLGFYILLRDIRSRAVRLFAGFLLINILSTFIGLVRLVPTNPLTASRLLVAAVIVIFAWNSSYLIVAINTIFYRPNLSKKPFQAIYLPFILAALLSVIIWIVYQGLPDPQSIVTPLTKPGLYTIDTATFPILMWAVVYQVAANLVALGMLVNIVLTRAGVERRSAIILSGTTLACAGFSFIFGVWSRSTWHVTIPGISNIVLSLLFGYAILRYGLFSTQTVAIDLAWDNLRDGILVLRADRFILNCNQSAANLLGLSKEFVQNKNIDTVLRFSSMPRSVWADLWRPLQQGHSASCEATYTLAQAEQIVTNEAMPIFDPLGQVQGYIWLLYDVTAQRRGEIEIQKRNQELEQALRELRVTNQAQNELLEAIRVLSAQAVPVLQHIIVLPLSGPINSDRAQLIMSNLLDGIRDHDARVSIIDITGVPGIDTSTAGYLIQAARAGSLMGCRPLLVGIRPEIAQVLVELGIDLQGIKTFSDLQSGVEYALRLMGLELMARSTPSTPLPKGQTLLEER